MGLHGEFGCDRDSEVLTETNRHTRRYLGMMPEARAWGPPWTGAETAVGVGNGLVPKQSVFGVLPRVVRGENT